MKSLVASAAQAAIVGFVIAAGLVAGWYLASGVDTLGFLSSLARIIHVLAAILWVGMIWFVNFVQLAALSAADDAGRTALMRHVVPRVATIFRHTSSLTLLSGFALLVTSGYLLERWVYKSAVYIPPLKSSLLIAAVVASIVMWGLVHFIIWPALKIVLEHSPADADAKARARERIRLAARINLILALPVTTVMVMVSHA